MEANGTTGTILPTSSNSTNMPDDSEWRPVFLGFPEFNAPALCAQTDPDEFFPELGGDHGRAAKKICRECRAQAECLEWALANNETFGVWGGLTTRERRTRAGLPPAPPVARPVPEAAGNRKPRRVLKPAERDRVRKLTAMGWSAAQIGRELEVNERTVYRVRSEQRAEAEKNRAVA